MAKLTKSKAKKILREGIVQGRKLSARQKRFFGAIAGGQRPLRKKNNPSGGSLFRHTMGMVK